MKDRKELVPALSAVLFLTFTLIIAAPLFLYATNKDELWFDIYTIAPVLGISAVCLILILMVLSFLAFRMGKTAGRFFTALIFALGAAFYLQGNFIGCDYGQLNGDQIQWGSYVKYAAESIAVWAGIPIILFIFIKLKGWKFFSSLVPYICGALFLMQTAGLLSVAIPERIFEMKDMRVSSTEGFNTYSKNKNVITLVFDSLDSALFIKELEEDPGLKEELKDFTFYPDTSGMYQNTKCSAPYIMTGQLYRNEQPYKDYIVDAFEKTTLYDSLESEGFLTGLYCGRDYISPEMTGRLMNFRINRNAPSSYPAFTGLLYKFVMFRYAPHQLKKYFWFYSGDFNALSASEGGSGEGGYTMFPDEEFVKSYRLLIGNDIELTDSNIFKYIHTRGVHRPYEFDENIEPLKEGDKGDIYSATKGCMKFVQSLTDKLKEAGVYDNTALIITADHGYIYYHQNPFFLYKGFNADEAFKVSESPVSFEDLLPAYEKLIEADTETKDTGDIFENAHPDGVRPFYFYEWNTEIVNWMPPIKVFEIRGPAADLKSFVETDISYKAGGETAKGIYEFNGNDKIVFDDSDKCNSIIKVGVSSYIDNEMGVKKRWSNAPVSEFQINLPEGYDKDLLVNIKADTKDKEEQTVEISVNDKEIDTLHYAGGSFEFKIPAGSDENGVLGIRLSYPDREMDFGERGVTLHFIEMDLTEE